MRWAIGEAFPTTTSWPWAIFVVNAVGSFLLAHVLVLTRHRTDDVTIDPVRLAVGTGFCGALTTFSTFAVDVAALGRDDEASTGAGFLVASLVVGVAAFVAGRQFARRVVTT